MEEFTGIQIHYAGINALIGQRSVNSGAEVSWKWCFGITSELGSAYFRREAGIYRSWLEEKPEVRWKCCFGNTSEPGSAYFRPETEYFPKLVGRKARSELEMVRSWLEKCPK